MDMCEEIRACLDGNLSFKEPSSIDPRLLPDNIFAGAIIGATGGFTAGLAPALVPGGQIFPIAGAALGFIGGAIGGAIVDVGELIIPPLKGPPIYAPQNSTLPDEISVRVETLERTTAEEQELQEFREFRQGILEGLDRYGDDPMIIAGLFQNVWSNDYVNQFYSAEEIETLKARFEATPDLEGKKYLIGDVVDNVLYEGTQYVEETASTEITTAITTQQQTPQGYVTVERLQQVRSELETAFENGLTGALGRISGLEGRVGSLESRIGSLESNNSERVSREPQSSDELAGFA